MKVNQHLGCHTWQIKHQKQKIIKVVCTTCTIRATFGNCNCHNYKIIIIFDILFKLVTGHHTKLLNGFRGLGILYINCMDRFYNTFIVLFCHFGTQQPYSPFIGKRAAMNILHNFSFCVPLESSEFTMTWRDTSRWWQHFHFRLNRINTLWSDYLKMHTILFIASLQHYPDNLHKDKYLMSGTGCQPWMK